MIFITSWVRLTAAERGAAGSALQIFDQNSRDGHIDIVNISR